MSVQAITCALAQRGVSASEKLLLLALANYADENLQCWPSQTRLAADTCLSERTVRTLLAKLEERGSLSRASRRRPDGSRATDLLTLHFRGEAVSGTDRQPAMVAGGTGNGFRGVPEVVSPLTTFEPSSTTTSEANASSVPVVGKPNDPVREAFDAWNELAARRGLPKAKTLDRSRRAAIRGRLSEGGEEAWTQALAAVERSPLCLGENDRGWRADLDFVCQAKSWRRLLEGFYGGPPPARGSPSNLTDISRQLPLVPKRVLTDEEARAEVEAELAAMETGSQALQ